MKARLGELQARLDQHERKQKQQKRTSSQDITEQCIAPSAISTFSAHSSGEESSPSPVSADKPSTPQSIPMMHQPAIYDPCPDDLDGANMFAAHTAAGAHLLNSPPNSNHSPQPNDLLSPPVRPVTDASGKPVSQDFMLDCLRFQTSLFPAEQHPQHPQHPQHHHHHHHQQQQYPTYPEAGVAPGAISQPGEVPCVDGFPGHSESMEFAFEPAAPVDVWKQDPMMPKMQETPPASDVVNFPAMAGPGPQGPSPPAAMDSALDPNMDPAMMNAARTSQPPPPPPSGPSGPQRTHVANDERFTSILEHVQAAGFESFDALVTAYYSDNFDESSALANEQRLSRNRRLPKVLSDLFHAADGWTPWERRGFHEEILKTAESMLISEGGVAKHTLLTKLSPLLDNQEACTPEIVNAMKRSVQNDVSFVLDVLDVLDFN